MGCGLRQPCGFAVRDCQISDSAWSHGNIEIAVAAIKQGAYDFIEKPFNIDQLLVVIRRAMETSKLRRENTDLKRQDSGASEMIGASAAYRALVSQLDKVTKSNGRVMLTGPAGSGKEIAARYIHTQSNRASAPFVTVNCASIEPDRMEEVLFGRESAERGVEPGLLEQAHALARSWVCADRRRWLSLCAAQLSADAVATRRGRVRTGCRA